MQANATWIADADDRNEARKLPWLLRFILKCYRPEVIVLLNGRLDAARRRNVIEKKQADELIEIFGRTLP